MRKDTFDAVVISDVHEHIADRPRLLRRLAGSVLPACVLIRVPRFKGDRRVPLKKGRGGECRLDPTHETGHTLDSLARIRRSDDG